MGPLYRHGDVLLAFDPLAETLRTPGWRRVRDGVLVKGETGHAHAIAEPRGVRLWREKTRRSSSSPREPELLLEIVVDRVDLVHPEHTTITLPRGWYRVWRQREARVGGGSVRVAD